MVTLYECITPKIDKKFRQEIYQKTLEAKQKGTTVEDIKKSIPLLKNAIQDWKMEKEVKEHVLEVISEEIKKVFPEIYIEEVRENGT